MCRINRHGRGLYGFLIKQTFEYADHYDQLGVPLSYFF